MRFMTRALVGLAIVVMTVALLGAAAFVLKEALEKRMAPAGPAPVRQERVQAVRTVRIEPRKLAPHISGHGEVTAREKVELRARAGGTIVAVNPALAEGRPVEKGALLVAVDPREAEARLEEAQVNLEDAEAERAAAERALALARKDLETARQQARLRERALARQRDLLARGATTEAAVEQAELVAVQAREALVARERALAEAEARLDRAKVMVERRRIQISLAEQALEDTRLLAPIAGIADGVNLTQGATLTPGERLGTLFNPASLEVSFTVSLADHARLSGAGADAGSAIGRPVEIRLELGGELGGEQMRFAGRIVREAPMAEGAGGGRRLFAAVEEGAKAADDAFMGRTLRPGDFVRLLIEAPPVSPAARIPSTALGSDGAVLALGPDGRLERVVVQVIHREGDEVLIAVPAELAGRRIVAVRAPALAPGVKVRPIEAQPGGEGRRRGEAEEAGALSATEGTGSPGNAPRAPAGANGAAIGSGGAVKDAARSQGRKGEAQ